MYANNMQNKKGSQGEKTLNPLILLAERGGFEPPLRFRKHAFQACAISHSATSPVLEWRREIKQ